MTCFIDIFTYDSDFNQLLIQINLMISFSRLLSFSKWWLLCQCFFNPKWTKKSKKKKKKKKKKTPVLAAAPASSRAAAVGGQAETQKHVAGRPGEGAEAHLQKPQVLKSPTEEFGKVL